MPYVLDRQVDRPVIHQGRPATLRALAGAVLMLSLGVAADGATAQTVNRPAPAQAQSPAGQKPGAAQPAGDPVEAQLGDIKKRLNITAAQQSQFDQFANIVKQNAADDGRADAEGGQSAEQSAVEGLRNAASFAQTEADNLKRLVPALEGLYASLTDQQKRTADSCSTRLRRPDRRRRANPKPGRRADPARRLRLTPGTWIHRHSTYRPAGGHPCSFTKIPRAYAGKPGKGSSWPALQNATDRSGCPEAGPMAG